MPTTHLICGTVPPDSPLQALAGRTITVRAASPTQLAARLREMRAAGIAPIVVALPRPLPWTGITLAITGAVLAALAAALTAILTGHTPTAWVAVACMVAAGLALVPVLAHLEREQGR